MGSNRLGFLLAAVLCRAVDYYHLSREVAEDLAEGMGGTQLDHAQGYLRLREHELGKAIGAAVEELKELK